jgi:hypothetical protein
VKAPPPFAPQVRAIRRHLLIRLAAYFSGVCDLVGHFPTPELAPHMRIQIEDPGVLSPAVAPFPYPIKL